MPSALQQTRTILLNEVYALNLSMTLMCLFTLRIAAASYMFTVPLALYVSTNREPFLRLSDPSKVDACVQFKGEW
jgi:hypothetical protein